MKCWEQQKAVRNKNNHILILYKDSLKSWSKISLGKYIETGFSFTNKKCQFCVRWNEI
jgi:hypothetical protein